ncbi:MAG TPA: MEDS domain-containing protein [Micropepsaceae bacterium]|nr:MEDS domain-containing protein [Micropepsaceae bacterium]
MTSLQGLRVLVVEDEAPIAMMLEDMIEDMGCVLAGSAASISEALRLVDSTGFDFALLDINLAGKSAVTVADRLAAKGIPFVIGSGYGRTGLPAHLQSRQVIQKPFLHGDLEKAIRASLEGPQNPIERKAEPRHQCLIYAGAPSDQLKGLAATIAAKLNAGYRCLYLNSPPMVAGIRTHLAAIGRDVEQDMADGRVVLSSSRDHLVDGKFDPRHMLSSLKAAHDAALSSGFAGLWASGDMSWEFGPEQDFARLVEYEQELEAFLQANPTICGICQYHSDILPREALRTGLTLHPALYVNETLARLNPHYAPNSSDPEPDTAPDWESAVPGLLAPGQVA